MSRRRRLLNTPTTFVSAVDGPLLQKIKEKLGFGSGPAEREETDPEVTVEREPEPESEPESEPAGVGTDGRAGRRDRGRRIGR